MPLLERLRALPAPAWVLFAGTFLNRFGTFVVVFLVLYLTSNGFSPAQAGFVAGTYGLGGVSAMLLGGSIADRLGRREGIALSMFTSAAAMLLLSQAERLPTIAALAILAGTAAELYRPAAAALLTDLTPPGQRLTGFAVYRTAVNAGMAVGPAVAGLLAEHSFMLIFVGDALTSLAFGTLALLWLPRGPGPLGPVGKGDRALLAITRDRGFLLLLAACTLGALVLTQYSSSYALHVRHLGFPVTTFGALVSLNAVMVATLELPSTSITGRLPVRPAIAAGFGLFAIGFGWNAIATTLPMLAAGVALWSLGEILAVPLLATHVADLAPDHMRGRYQAAFNLTFAAGFAVGPALGTALWAASPRGIWIACLAADAAAAVLVLLSGRHPGRSGAASG